jgi:AraC-like DNA-binding protein
MDNLGAAGGVRDRLGGYREHAPPPQLTTVAEGVWVYRAPPDARPEAATHRVLPDPAMSVAFWCGREGDGRPVAPRVVLIGAKTRPHVVTFGPGSEIAAVRLKLEWTEPLLGLLPAEHHDAEENLSLVLPRLARLLLDSLVETRTAGQSLAALVAAIAEESGRVRGPGPGHAARALDLVRRTAGRMPVAHVAGEVGVSLRHLRRAVRRTGVSLKAYARTTRFLNAMTTADRTPAPGWARIAADSGFADQSHLVRECRALAGMTPGAVHAERRAEAEISNRW